MSFEACIFLSEYLRDSEPFYTVKLISVGCPSALPPKAGSSAVETDGLASVTHFACNNGYIIFGNSNITCQTSGAWNYEAPQCGIDFYYSIIMWF